MGLLLGTSAAKAAPTVDLDGNTATGIQNLEVEGTLYNVAFLLTSADDLYGTDPIFDFSDNASAKTAKIAVNLALNNVDQATKVGPSSEQGVIDYGIGFEKTDVIKIQNATYVGDEVQAWVDADVDIRVPGDLSMYADFTLAGPPADPVTIGGSVTGLEGGGLVLQNNGSDDETITADGTFTFDTPLTPGTSYNVTVATNPSDPAQTCSVDNGSGQVPTEAVTNVAVSCAELVVGNIIKVAAEGDTLPDGTLLKQIVLDGGVAINIFGKVAFGGRNDDNTISVFTQDGLVAAEFGTLADGTVVDDISPFGKVSISAGQSGDRVAFHGRTDRDKAVFTQAGVVAREGGTLPDGTLVDEIKDLGRVAINDFDQAAFHGRVEIEIDDGLGDKEKFNAVFTSLGMVVREGSEMPDLTIVEGIDETGGVAINDFGDVAFHGDVLEPDTGADAVEAVFTTEGLIAKREEALPNGTIVSDIDENGGVAMNIFGEVAFHGDVVVPNAGTDAVRAVLIQDGFGGLVIKEGDTLPDGTILDEITENGGVAINFFGDVVFHGRTGGIKAVFTQDGLVAKEGDALTDGTILDEIHQNGGVAINFEGEVAFHGKIGSTDAVFFGKTPIVVLFADGNESSSE